ncbi:Ig-like domain-containing protein [Chloroflexota bacterium]
MKKLVSNLKSRCLPFLTVFVIPMLIVGCGPGQASTPTPANSPTPTPTQNTGPNHTPVIDNVIPEWTQIERGKSGLIKLIAHDPDGDVLTYSWQTDRGSLSGDGDTVNYTAPQSYVTVTVTVRVSDGRGGMVAAGVNFEVVCCGAAVKNPEWID